MDHPLSGGTEEMETELFFTSVFGPVYDVKEQMHIYGLSLLLNEGFTIDCCVIGNLLRPSFST